MAGLIAFNANYLENQGKTQKADKPFPAGMTFDVHNLVEVLIAAGKADPRIGAAVGSEPQVFDVGGPFATCVMTTGILKMPTPRPANALYWDVFDKKNAACKSLGANYLEVKEGMHISGACTDPHMTVLIFSSDRKQVGQNIHVCAEAAGTQWKFTRVHG